jgi:hypothetical protein
MPYGTVLADNITSSGTLNVAGGIVGSTDLSATGTITSSDGTIYPLVATTAVATTSGASVTIATDIPSWAKRITVVLNSVALLATANIPKIQLGYGTTPTWVTTGYQSAADNFTTTSGPTVTSTIGFQLSSNGAGSYNLTLLLCKITGTNTWVGSLCGGTPGSVLFGGGLIVLTDPCTAVRLFTSASTFSSGSAFIMYE